VKPTKIGRFFVLPKGAMDEDDSRVAAIMRKVISVVTPHVFDRYQEEMYQCVHERSECSKLTVKGGRHESESK